MYKVSIIVCCFNVEKWLSRNHLSNILQQTYKNIEIILIDDGSSDKTVEICDELGKIDSRVRVIHQENKGLGEARNTGLNYATGDYIWFYDVDDDIKLELIESCLDKAVKYDAELVVFSFCALAKGHKPQDVIFNEHLIVSNDELKKCYINDLLLIPNGNGFVWNKFYKRSFIDKHNIAFSHNRIQQDEEFNLRLYPYLERVYISPEILYYYNIYESGNNRSRYIEDRFKIYVSVRNEFEFLRNFWQIKSIEFDKYLHKRFISNIITCINYNLLHVDCPLNNQEKNQNISIIMDNGYSKQAISFCKKNQMLNLETRIYLGAYEKSNILYVKILVTLFALLRKIKAYFK